MFLKADERPYYDAALKALSEAHEAVFKHKDRDVLGMSHGPFSGVNEALSIVLRLETLSHFQAKEIKQLKLEVIKLGYNDPTRKNNMDTNTEMALTDVKHFVVDPVTGERTEVEAPVLGEVQAGEGPVATEYTLH